MRLVFMGSPDFSVPVLDALVKAGHEIAAVYCQPPRPAGRGKKERPTAVHARALELGLDVRHPVSLKSEEAQKDFADLKPEVAVVVAYGLILPQAILDTPAYGCLNIHASLLPRWRGAAPIHRAIMAGDTDTGVCIMQMEAGLDTGPVLLRTATQIGAEETTLQLHDRLSALGSEAIVTALDTLPTLTPVAQPDTGVTYAEKIRKDEARIDWTQSSDEDRPSNSRPVSLPGSVVRTQRSAPQNSCLPHVRGERRSRRDHPYASACRLWRWRGRTAALAKSGQSGARYL